MASQNTTATANKIYRSLLEGSLERDPNSAYWRARLQVVAKLLAEQLYRDWYDARFPGEDDGSRAYTLREKAEAAQARLDESQPGAHRGAAIARKLNIPVDGQGV